MGPAFITFLVTLLIVAVFTLDSFAFILLYLFAGAFLVGRWWINHSAANIRFSRKFERRAFPGETIPVTIEIKNSSRLPVVWLHAQESLPLGFSHQKVLQKVITLGSKSQDQLEYRLTPQKRGYYALGPLQLSAGDLLGLVQEKVIQSESDYLTVYPKVIPLNSIQLPSHSPLGELRFKEPIFEDPSRSIGKRDYRVGDSLRRVDWKSTAAVGKLQVKLFEPSIALETLIFLNLNAEEYHYKFRFSASELAIVVAASLANWIIQRKQMVGLVVNGQDPLAVDHRPQTINPRKGRGHMMRLLETLARVQLASVQPIERVLSQHCVGLSWGTTIILVTGSAEESLFNEFFQLRRNGLNIVLVLCGEVIGLQEIELRAEKLRLPFFHIRDEKDLGIWRK